MSTKIVKRDSRRQSNYFYRLSTFLHSIIEKSLGNFLRLKINKGSKLTRGKYAQKLKMFRDLNFKEVTKFKGGTF